MFLANLFEKKNNITQNVISLIKILKVPITTTSIANTLEQHPDYPSIFSISDSLKKWKIENLVLETDPQKLEELPTPFLAHTKNNGGDFIVVISVNGSVQYLDSKGKATRESKEKFLKEWSNVVLLAEATEQSGEKDYTSQRKKERINNVHLPFILLAAITLSVLPFFFNGKNNSLTYLFLLPIIFSGCIITGLLLWFEIDKDNPFLKQICSAGKKTNCNAILSSKNAKIFNWLSWSEIGFFYFTGSFLFLILCSLNNSLSSLSLLAGINLLALPYIFYSVFYQWRIAKQWCRLCIIVQALLILEAVVFYFSSVIPAFPDNSIILTALISFAIPVLFWVFTKSILVKAQKAGHYSKELSKWKYNSELFQIQLLKQKAITVQEASALSAATILPHAAKNITAIKRPINPFGK